MIVVIRSTTLIVLESIFEQFFECFHASCEQLNEKDICRMESSPIMLINYVF